MIHIINIQKAMMRPFPLASDERRTKEPAFYWMTPLTQIRFLRAILFHGTARRSFNWKGCKKTFTSRVLSTRAHALRTRSMRWI